MTALVRGIRSMAQVRRGVSFGPLRLYASERFLEKGEATVPWGSGASDLLAVLVDRAGEIVGRGELRSRVWPNLTDEQGKGWRNPL